MPDASLNTPVPHPAEARYVIREFNVYNPFTGSPSAITLVGVLDSGSTVEIRKFTTVVPDAAHASATFSGLCTAMQTARSGEPAGSAGRLQYRILGFLIDHSYFPPVTLNP